MNTFLITTSGTTTVSLMAENYTTGPTGSLRLHDQFGNTIAEYTTWSDIAIINPAAGDGSNTRAASAYQPYDTRAVPAVAGTARSSNTTWTGRG